MLHPFLRLKLFSFFLLMSFCAYGEAGVVAFALGNSNVSKGSLVDTGDTIITGNNGHVHIKFIDGALVSIRPNSKLTIENYTYDPANPENNKVKFFLETGTVRSITGEAGKKNKKGFRMNTPQSAIGVRGTDYTVDVDESKVKIFVSSGGVGISPLNEACRKESFGVCEGEDLIELFAGQDYILELNAKNNTAHFIGTTSSFDSPAISLNDSIISDQLSFILNNSAAIPRTGKTEDVAWAHWSSFENLLNDNFIPMTSYLNEDWRILSWNSIHGLFIDGGYPTLPKSGSITFALDRYQAFSLNENTLASMAIESPSLSVDFTNNQVNTQFTVTNSTVTHTFNANATLNKLGSFTVQNGLLKLSGGLNKTLNQFGMSFEERLSPNLKVMGSSAWSKK